jgi:hypothetical protein
MSNDPVITVTPTITDGTVVRWYPSLDAAKRHDPVASASRNACVVDGDVPEEWIRAAEQAHARLSADSDADMSHLATHRRRLLMGDLEPIVKEGTP